MGGLLGRGRGSFRGGVHPGCQSRCDVQVAVLALPCKPFFRKETGNIFSCAGASPNAQCNLKLVSWFHRWKEA